MHKEFFVSFMYNNEEGGTTWGNTVISYEDWKEGEIISYSVIKEAEKSLAEEFGIDVLHIMGITEVAKEEGVE